MDESNDMQDVVERLIAEVRGGTKTLPDALAEAYECGANFVLAEWKASAASIRDA